MDHRRHWRQYMHEWTKARGGIGDPFSSLPPPLAIPIFFWPFSLLKLATQWVKERESASYRFPLPPRILIEYLIYTTLHSMYIYIFLASSVPTNCRSDRIKFENNNKKNNNNTYQWLCIQFSRRGFKMYRVNDSLRCGRVLITSGLGFCMIIIIL